MGACTVHVNGRRVNSCLSLALMHDGEEITTIEGLGTPDELHPMQAAFVAHDAYQCGYCTSGQIMSAVALLKEPCGPEDADVKELMSGNICRCGAYPNIVAAIQQVRGRLNRQAAVIAMHTFEFIRPKDPAEAVAVAAQAKTAQQGADVRFLAGGTTLIDLMKLNVETPARLIDINRLPLDKIEATPDGGLKIGATVRNSDLAHHPIVQRDYSVLSQAILSGASTQLRNMATTAGNLLQRTRCVYFRDTAMPCNKREPGTGCSAITGSNRTLAILGTSEHASRPTHRTCAWQWRRWKRPSTCRGRKAHARSRSGSFTCCPAKRRTAKRCSSRAISSRMSRFRRPLPGSRQQAVYLKLRDRASYEFALASAAVVITIAGGNVTHARIALGGVGTKPWRSPEAEAALVGQPATQDNFRKAAEAALRDAKPQSENAFKIELAKRCLTHALQIAATA